MTCLAHYRVPLFALALASFLAHAAPACHAQSHAALGIFEGQDDVGDNPKPGSASYNAASGEYRVTGGGHNMWGPVDAFHFLWKRAHGNFVLNADIRF